MTAQSDSSLLLGKVQKRSLLVGGGAAILALLGWALDATAFYQAYVMAFFLVLMVPLGSMGIVMLHHLTGGAWGFAIRRLLEAGIRTIPVVALMSIPLFCGLLFGDLYPWADPEAVAHDSVLQHKAPYLNKTFFLIRAGIYFTVWIVLGRRLLSLAEAHDRRGGAKLRKKMRNVAGPGIGIYAITMTFAAFDWGMSLEPHWFSTIYGAMFIVGQVLSTWCFSIVVSSWLAKREPFSRWIKQDHFHDLGNLTFAFTMLWAYVAFSQYLIIWSANLAEETPWYLRRTAHGWQGVAQFLIFFHFLVPFFCLLARKTKRSVQVLAGIALFMLVMRLVDMYWLIAPAFHEHLTFSWLYLVVPVALLGTWLSLYTRMLKGRPLVSLQDGAMEGSLEVGAQQVTQ